jgi:hypothetical protein
VITHGTIQIVQRETRLLTNAVVAGLLAQVEKDDKASVGSSTKT